MKRYANPRGTLILILIAVPLMILIDMMVFEGRTPFLFSNIGKPQEEPVKPVIVEATIVEEGLEFEAGALDTPEAVYLPQPEPVVNEVKESSLEPKKIKIDPYPKESLKKKSSPPKKAEQVKTKQYDWKRHAPPAPEGAAGKVVIMIDDMGMGSSTKKLISLPGPLTLSYLPYAKNLSEQTQRARQGGHELMLHMPMQPSNGHENPGPDVLTTNMGETELKAALNTALDSFSGYGGINNHMGSKLTSNEEAMGWVMEILKERGLFFVDSKTIGSSVGTRKAAEVGLRFAERDVFLDHHTDIASVRAALRKLEKIAWSQGVAIAIGHPKPATIQALKEWLPTLESRNLTLVPASAVVVRRSAPVSRAIISNETPAEISEEMPSFSMSLPEDFSNPGPDQAPVLLLE